MSLLARKADEIGSAIYRNLIFPFIRMALEIKSKSILKQGTYLKNTKLEGRNYVGNNTLITGSLLGFGSYVSRDSLMRNTKVGRYTSIGPEFLCIFGAHPVRDFVSTHPAFYSADPHQGFTYVNQTTFGEQKYTDKANGIQLEIGADVWIGARVSVCDGIKIGDGAVVAAGAVVVSDIEPYAIYGGVPAKKIGSRFDEKTVKKLLSDKWWEKSESDIKENIGAMENVEKYVLQIDSDV